MISSKVCPVCGEGKLHARVYHGTFKLRKMLRYSTCDHCKSDITNATQSRWNVARGNT